MKRINRLFLLLAILTTGCTTHTMFEKPDDIVYAPPEEETYYQPPQKIRGGGVYQTGYNWSLMADRRAYRIGDILTIQLDESTQSSKQARTNFGKQSGINLGVNGLFGVNTDDMNVDASGGRDFSGNGMAQQQNMLRGSITVAVHHVLPNGVLAVRGEKWLTLNQGDEYIRVTGLVRAEDVQRDNTVSSQRIANARISYAGRGAIMDANTAGWLVRFFNHPLFPL